jgi:hypothetical protein
MNLCSDADDTPVSNTQAPAQLVCTNCVPLEEQAATQCPHSLAHGVHLSTPLHACARASMCDCPCSSCNADAAGMYPDDAARESVPREDVHPAAPALEPECGRADSPALLAVCHEGSADRTSDAEVSAAAHACTSAVAEPPERAAEMPECGAEKAMYVRVQSLQPRLLPEETACPHNQHAPEQAVCMLGSTAAEVTRRPRQSKLRRVWSKMVRQASRAVVVCMPCLAPFPVRQGCSLRVE